jgi:hypothetical protein
LCARLRLARPTAGVAGVGLAGTGLAWFLRCARLRTGGVLVLGSAWFRLARAASRVLAGLALAWLAWFLGGARLRARRVLILGAGLGGAWF